MTKKESSSFNLGIMFAFGLPAIVWAFWGWKFALVAFVVPQIILSIIQSHD
jgi:hypothetical protein